MPSMPYASTATGAAIFTAVMLVFLAQEFTQGFDTPDSSSVRDDRWALVYLEVVPVLLVCIAGLLCLLGVSAWTASLPAFVVGIVVLLIGLALRQWSHHTLGRFHQALVTIQDEHDLVTSGPYRLVRHPMYTGSAIAFLGVGLALGTWPGLLLVFFGTLAAMVRRISVEERALTQALGEEYASYAADRSRMLPGVW